MDNDKKLKYLRELEKLKGSKIKADNYSSPLDEDVMKVKSLPNDIEEPITKIKGMTKKIDTNQVTPILSGNDFTSKLAALKALKGVGKKVAGVIPLAGVGMALSEGNPAMAAEELARDAVGPIGELGYEAIKIPSAGGEEEEQELLNDRNAIEDYKNSPAAKASKLAKLQALLGRQ